MYREGYDVPISDFRSKSDIVADMVREAILCGDLVPGERLYQVKLAARLSISPTPVREAFRRLETEGILDHFPDKGVRVAEAHLKDVQEICVMRCALEPLAIRAAVPRLTSADIKDLKTRQSDMERHVQDGELRSLLKLNYEFHMAIYKAAGMPLLYRVIRSLWTKYPWDTLMVVPGRAARSVAEHANIIKSIEEGDPTLAAQNVQLHIERGAESLVEYKWKHPRRSLRHRQVIPSRTNKL